MRGKDSVTVGRNGMYGITPAYAGKSITCYRNLVAVEDHPRLCGEKQPAHLSTMIQSGSPPPMRGKATPYATRAAVDRITPAYAGKSSLGFTSLNNSRDHPRLCGEKVQNRPQHQVQRGSPPPMRGKGVFSCE